MSLLEPEHTLRNVPSPQLEEVSLADFNGVSLSVDNGDATVSHRSGGIPGHVEGDGVTGSSPDGKDNNQRLDEVTAFNGSSHSSFASIAPLLGAEDLDQLDCDDDARKFFTSRDSLIDRAVHDIEKKLVDSEKDGSLIDAWLLTVVDHWDHEKEQLILLCQHSIFLVKYDFIALYIANYSRVELEAIDRIIIGKLRYPARSIAPNVHNVATKAGSFFKNVIKQLGEGVGRGGGILNFSGPLGKRNPEGRNTPTPVVYNNKDTAVVESSSSPDRYGIRLHWSSGRQPVMSQLWNPWSSEIPWTTIISHPLLQRKGRKNRTFDVEDFVLSLKRFLQRRNESVMDPLHRCLIDESPILMESYLGVSSLVHNFGELGYFKVRGKFSF